MRASLSYKRYNYTLNTDKDGACLTLVGPSGADNLQIHGGFFSGHSSATNAEADSFSLNLAKDDARLLAEAILASLHDGSTQTLSFG